MVTKEDLAQAILELKESQEEISRELKESNLELKASQEKTDRTVEKVSKMLGNMGNNQGEVAEEFFYNSLESNPTIAGINYDFIDKNVTRSKKGLRDEFDILLVNGKDVAINIGVRPHSANKSESFLKNNNLIYIMKISSHIYLHAFFNIGVRPH